MNYPNGQRRTAPAREMNNNNTFSNRGMSLEEDINLTNDFYNDIKKAVIHKKPTPVQIVKVHYPKRSAAVITEAYFKQASTTDYNGIYNGRYIDFEAKETKNKTMFPLANIHGHQVEHMKSVINQNGICFIIIRFSAFDETYFLEATKLFPFWNDKLRGGKKSIPYELLKEEGHLIPFHYQKRVDYLTVIDRLYF